MTLTFFLFNPGNGEEVRLTGKEVRAFERAHCDSTKAGNVRPSYQGMSVPYDLHLRSNLPKGSPALDDHLFS
jgi:hypothetical protein